MASNTDTGQIQSFRNSTEEYKMLLIMAAKDYGDARAKEEIPRAWERFNQVTQILAERMPAGERKAFREFRVELMKREKAIATDSTKSADGRKEAIKALHTEAMDLHVQLMWDTFAKSGILHNEEDGEIDFNPDGGQDYDLFKAALRSNSGTPAFVADLERIAGEAKAKEEAQAKGEKDGS